MFGYAFLAWFLAASALTIDMMRFDDGAFQLRFGQPRRAKIAAAWVWLFPLFMVFGIFWVAWWLLAGRPSMLAAWR